MMNLIKLTDKEIEFLKKNRTMQIIKLGKKLNRHTSVITKYRKQLGLTGKNFVREGFIKEVEK